MNRTITFTACCSLGILTSALTAAPQLSADKPATQSTGKEGDIRPAILQYKQTWLDFFDLLDKIQDQTSADKAVAQLRTQGELLNKIVAENPDNRNSPAERKFLQQTAEELQQINREKQQADRIIQQAFYESNALFDILIDETYAFNTLFRTEACEYHAMALAFKSLEKADKEDDPYRIAKDDLEKDGKPHHDKLLARPGSPYKGGMGLTSKDAVVLDETDDERQQKLQAKYLQTVYPTAKPFYGLFQAGPDGSTCNIVVVNIADDIAQRTGKRPTQPVYIPVYFKVPAAAPDEEAPEED